ncbi:mitochondrial ribosomal death-associated protein 3-domain-containing protein [Coniochaeta sp. 2T2.1]|nr:mitochondrial ribosomal death-associated protein 3-domain-containing protein [Coniochaeta sp. 2T2.1]
MSVPNSLRCLLRPSTATTTSIPRRIVSVAVFAASFSSSSILAKSPMAAKPKIPSGKAAKILASGHIRAGKKMQLGKFKKSKNLDRSRPPAPGERKAYRKRVTLSNNNALPVEGLEAMSAEALVDPAKVGRMLALPNELVDQLRAVEAFKATQTWNMFRQPSMLQRKEARELAEKMQKAAGKGETLKLVISGDRLVGKSMLLLQAISYAYLNNWIVLHVPEGQDLTNASTEYAPLPDTTPTQYSQQAYALRMLQALRKANQQLLFDLKTVLPHPDLVQHFPVGTSVLQLANAAKEADTTWPIFSAVLQELTVEGHGRPPILFSLDGLSFIMKMSEYRSPAYELVHAHDLAIVRRFVDLLSGKTKLPSGGAVIAATTRGNSPRNPSMELAIARQEAAQGLIKEAPVREPYSKKYDDRAEGVLSNFEVLKLKSVSRSEARSLMEYWAASGLLRTAVDEQAVSDKWILGGNGNLGEMERATLLTMRF